MNLRLAVIPATLIPIIIIAVEFDIGIQDVLAVGVLPFAAAALVMMAKLVLQGAKLGYIVRAYAGAKFDRFWKLCGVRVGSEFVKFTTPMFVGAEFVVIYYLHKKGLSPSKASWIAILDIVTEVLAAGILSIMAGVIALAVGSYAVAAIVLGTSIPITTLWMVLFFLSSKRTFQLPRAISSLAMMIAKKKGAGYVRQSNEWMAEVCNMSRENLHTRKAQKVFAYSLAMSLASWIFYGISFAVIAWGAGYAIGAFDSVMAVMGANAIGNLPITVGGSGLAEFGIIAYLNNLNPFSLDIAQGNLEWAAVIGWRIATYYVPIAVTWVLLVKLALTKYDKAAPARA